MVHQFVMLRDVGLESVTLAPGLDMDLPCALRGTNLADTNPSFALHLQQAVYSGRTAHLDPISILRLPPGTTVYGGTYVTRAEGAWLSEQYLPRVSMAPAVLDGLLQSSPLTIEVSGESLLVARYGIATWGHWLAELFPKIVLAEAAFPGRFRYVLPREATQAALSEVIWFRLQECLRSIGIAPSRICPILSPCAFRFARLFAMSPVWSDDIVHPVASAALRDAMRGVAPGRVSKLAILRDPTAGRGVANLADVYAAAEQRGYVTSNTGSLGFLEQVSLFKGATDVFGVLGSDLANLIFSPEGVRLISIAPDHFGDRFFYALVLDRSGSMTDIRGPETAPHSVRHKAMFSVGLPYLETILDAVPTA